MNTTTNHLSVGYQCPECDQRYLDERRCPRLPPSAAGPGVGAGCPHCDEPVAISVLNPQETNMTPT